MSFNNLPQLTNSDSITYAYKWSLSLYDGSDTSTVITPKFIESITKVCEYKKKKVGMTVVTARFKLSDVARLKEIEKHCLCKLECSVYEYNPRSKDDQSNTTNSYEKVGSGIIFSTTYIPIFDKNTFKAVYKKNQLQFEDMNDNVIGVNTGGEVTVNFGLLNCTFQKISKSMYNEVIDGDIDVGTVINWIISTLPIEDAIVDMPNNQIKQKNIIIPPMNLVQAIEYIQTMYGIYENGIQIYYDDDETFYILDKYSNDHDGFSYQSFVTHMYITDVTESMTPTSIIRAEAGRLKNKITDAEVNSKDAIYYGPIRINFSSSEISKSEIDGDTFVFSSFQQGINAVSYVKGELNSKTAKDVSLAMLRNTETHAYSGNKVVADYDELNNPYNMASYFNELENTAMIFTITLDNCNIDDFKPNMLVQLHFENTEQDINLGGMYHIYAVTFNFNRSKDSSATNMVEVSETDVNEFPDTITSGSCTLLLCRKRI